jgi:hypothetical protein
MILSVSGCGYQFTVEGSGPVIGGGRVVTGTPVRLALHTLKNNTFEPALEFKYTGYLRRALKSGGGAEIVEDEHLADYIMDGAILSVSFPSLAFSQTQTQESRVRVKVSVKVKERKTGKVRWSQTGTATAEFFVGATSTGAVETGLQFNRTLQDRAIEQAGVLVAVNLVDGFLAARDNGMFRDGDSTSDPATSLKGVNSKSSEPANVPLPTRDRLH